MARRLYLPGVARKTNKVATEKVMFLKIAGVYGGFLIQPKIKFLCVS